MKVLPLFAVFSLLLPCVRPAHGQESRLLKIGIVDMARVYSEYHKTREAEKRLESEKYAVKKDLEERSARLKELITKFEECHGAIADPAISESLRADKRNEAKEVGAEARTLEREIADFRRRRQQQLVEQTRRMRDGIMEEILEVVREVSQIGSYDVVFDKSGLGVHGIPFLLHSRAAVDFSGEILKRLNAQ